MYKNWIATIVFKILLTAYNALIVLLCPVIILYLLKRSLKNKKYLKNWDERFGYKLKNISKKPIIWIHTVSVGETKAAQKLIQLYEKQFPKYQILVTVMSVTGRNIAKNEYPNAIIHYLPYDFPYTMNKFYDTFKPKLGIIFETEIWPNMLQIANKKNIPIVLANARLSQKSFASYYKFRYFTQPIINNFSKILVQDTQTQQYFKQLNYQNSIEIMGSTKFDLTITNATTSKIDLFQKIFQPNNNKPIICFASSRENEELLLINALKECPDDNSIYLIIPRHPERFEEVEKLLKANNLIYQKKSAMQTVNPDTQFIIGDSMGELLSYYSISKTAIIGGSFMALGGQNPLEAIYMSIPVIFGPHMFNFKQISEMLLESQIAYQVQDMPEALKTAQNITTNNNSTLSHMCQNFIAQNTGASEKILEHSKQYLK